MGWFCCLSNRSPGVAITKASGLGEREVVTLEEQSRREPGYCRQEGTEQKTRWRAEGRPCQAERSCDARGHPGSEAQPPA